MQLEDIFAEAKKKRESFWQLSALRSHKPDDMDMGDLLWEGFRAGLFQPCLYGHEHELRGAPSGFTKAELYQLLCNVDKNPGSMFWLGSFRYQGCGAGIVNCLRQLKDTAQGEDGVFVEGWEQVHESVRPALGYLLVSEGQLPPDVLDDKVLEWVAWAAIRVSGNNKDYHLGYRDEMLATRESIWSDEIWATAIGHVIEQGDEDLHDYKVIYPIRAHLTNAQLLKVALHRMEREEKDTSAAILRERGKAILPALDDIVINWSTHEDAHGRNGESLNILMAALIGIHIDLGMPPLAPTLDNMLRDALWVDGPVREVLGALPIDRVEALLLKPDHMPTYPYTYMPAFPTPVICQHLVDVVVGLTGEARYSDRNALPQAIVELGSPMVPLMCTALEKNGGLHRDLFIRCLGDIGDPAGIQPLVKALSDTGPRIAGSHSSERVHDIPDIAAEALQKIAKKVPEDVMLAALSDALEDENATVRGWAITVLTRIPPTEAVFALASRLTTEEDPSNRAKLDQLCWSLALPDAVRALRDTPLEQTQLEDIWENGWRENDHTVFLPALKALGPAVIAWWTRKMRTALLNRNLSTSFSESILGMLFEAFPNHPASSWLALEVLSVYPSSAGYYRSGIARQLQAWAVHIPTLPADWIALVKSPARPTSWTSSLKLPDNWLVGADDVLCDALGHDDPDIRQEALERLCNREDTDPTPALPLLSSRDKTIRLLAIQLFKHVPNVAVIPHLQAASKRERARANKSALEEAMAMYTPEQIAAAEPLPLTKKSKKSVSGKKTKKTKKTKKADTPRPVWTDWLADDPLATPSEVAWGRLLVHIELNPPNVAECAMLNELLMEWPNDLRNAPDGWIVSATRRKQPPPYWSLARAVHCHFVFSQNPVKLTPARIRWLLTSPHMRAIRHLTLRHYNEPKLERAILEGLAESSNLAALQTLDLNGCRLLGSGIKVLTQATWLTELTHLNLGERFLNGSWSVPHATELLSSPHLSALQSLVLDWVTGEDILEAVLTLPHLANVHSLSLGASSCSHEQLLRLVAVPRAWQSLRIGSNSIKVESAKALADSDNLGSLKELILTGPIGGEGVLALLSSAKLPALEILVLHGCDVAPSDIEPIRNHPRTAQLMRLVCNSEKLPERILISRE